MSILKQQIFLKEIRLFIEFVNTIHADTTFLANCCPNNCAVKEFKLKNMSIIFKGGKQES